MTKHDILVDVLSYSREALSSPRKLLPIQASGVIITPEDVESIVEAALSFWYTEHKFCARFKRNLGNYLNVGHVTLTNSGSSANLLAITSALDYFKSKGKYIVTCATNFPTTVAPIYQNNRIPIYVDIDPETLSPNLEQFEYVMKKYGHDVAGVIFAHTLGFPFDEVKVFDILRSNDQDGNKWLIADACDALGANGVMNDIKLKFPVGFFSDLSTYSFFPAHHITTGEGGAIATTNKKLGVILESYGSWGRDCYCLPGNSNTCGKRFSHEWEKLPSGWDHKYTFTRVGYNLKMTELQAALGVSQLERIDEVVEKRKNNFYFLAGEITPHEEFISTIKINSDLAEISPFGFPILVHPQADFTANELIAFLEENEIRTRRVFAGNITRQPGYQNLPYLSVDLTGSDRVMNDMFWIGCQDALTMEQLEYMEEKISEFMRRYE